MAERSVEMPINCRKVGGFPLIHGARSQTPARRRHAGYAVPLPSHAFGCSRCYRVTDPASGWLMRSMWPAAKVIRSQEQQGVD